MTGAGLVERATGRRHGIVDPPVTVPLSAADVVGFHHASVALDAGRSGGGGAGRTAEDASVAAVAEALERWSGVFATLDARPASSVDPARCLRLDDFTLHHHDQRTAAGFPHRDAYPVDEQVAAVHDLLTNEPGWAPAALITLSDHYGAIATSSGLAADPSVVRALLRATQELVERDAYVVTWLHQLGGRLVDHPGVDATVGPTGGAARVYDLTPAWSPHPVAAVAGTVPLAGRPRHSIGLACRARWSEAVDKALAEFLQGTMFVAHHLAGHPELLGCRPEEVVDFDRHAVYYSASPDRWAEVPLHRHAVAAAPPADAHRADLDPAAQLHDLVGRLSAAGVRLRYRELTSVECHQVGLRVVRVLAPDLTPLHHDHRWPFLGGRSADRSWRYPDAEQRAGGRTFPSPHPHALG